MAEEQNINKVKILSSFELPERLMVNRVPAWFIKRKSTCYYYKLQRGIHDVLFLRIPFLNTKVANKDHDHVYIEDKLFKRTFGEFYLSNLDRNDAVCRFFDSIAEEYEKNIILELNKFVISRLFELTTELLGHRNSKVKILDFGIGTGISADIVKKKLTNLEVELQGVDISKRMVEICEKKNLDVKQYNGVPLQFCTDYFDGIIVSFAIHYVQEAELMPLLSEFQRVLQPSGVLAFNVHPPTLEKAISYFRALKACGFRKVYLVPITKLINAKKYNIMLLVSKKC